MICVKMRMRTGRRYLASWAEEDAQGVHVGGGKRSCVGKCRVSKIQVLQIRDVPDGEMLSALENLMSMPKIPLSFGVTHTWRRL